MLSKKLLFGLLLYFEELVFIAAYSGSGDAEGSGSGNVFLSAQEANTFHRGAKRCIFCISEGAEEQEEDREERKEEARESEVYNLDDSELRSLLLGCCGTGKNNKCNQGALNYYQKRARSGGINAGKFVSRTCEISFRENHGDCWCAGKQCGEKYYKERNGNCANPCRKTQFYCNSMAKTRLLSSATCVARNKKCDSSKDCPEAEDEDGCKITNRLSEVQIKTTAKLSFEAYTVLNYETGQSLPGWKFAKLDYVGVAFINNHPICNLHGEEGTRSLTQKTADVFCKTMQNTSPKTKGLPLIRSLRDMFGSETVTTRAINKPLMTDVTCKGNEDYFGACAHKTYNKWCDNSSINYVTVACLDPEQLKLTGKYATKFQGKPTYIGLPIAYDYRTYKNTAKTICTTLFGEEFGRKEDGVPHFSALGVYHLAPRTTCLQVKCKEAKGTINDCEIEFNAWCEAKTYITNVMCAQCSISTLQRIVDGVKVEEKSSALIDNIIAARAKLNDECRWWDDCLTTDEEGPRYKEFCMVKNFLDNALYTMQPAINRSYMKGTNIVYLPSQMTDSKKLLELTGLKIQFLETKGLIRKVGEQIITAIGGYFDEMANFDRDLAKADAGYAFGKWKESQKAATRIQSNLDPLLSKIITAAIKSADAKVQFEEGMMSLTILNALNPMRLMSFDFGGVLEVAEQLRALQEANKDKLILVSYLPDQFKTLQNHASKMSTEIWQNKAVFDKVNSLVTGSVKEIAITDYKSSRKFLEAYNDYTPAVTKNGVSTFVNLVEDLVDKCCETIEGSVSPAAEAEIKAKSCPKIKSQLASLEAYFEDLEEQQFDIMDSLARMARAKVAEFNALELKNTGKGAKPMLTKTLLEKNIEVVLRTQRLMYIDDACNYLAYMRHGAVNEDCQKLKEDPTLSSAISNLEAQRDVKICESSHVSKKWVKIPISSIKNEDGYLNITALFDPEVERRATFVIPSRQWLVDHKWIYAIDTGPFYIQKVNLHVPPTNGKKNQYKVVINFSGLNKIGDKTYKVAGKQVLTNEYTENMDQCSLSESFDSKYSVKECNGNLNKVCIHSQGSISNRILPVLVGNTWSISMNLLKGRTKPLHVSDGYIFAQISVCSKESSEKRSETDPLGKVSQKRKCCLPKQIWSMESKQCVDCPANYQPFMWDTFCEMCLPGYQSTTLKFGCKACPQGKFKAKSGPGQCEDCPAGTTTKGSAATECVESG